MATKLHLLILFLAILKCNGHVPILSDILSGTHSVIHEVAGGVIDHISNGFHVNIDGKFDLNKKVEQTPNYGNRPQNVPQGTPETIIVVVEKEQNHHHNHHHHNKPYGNNNGQYGPGYNEFRPHQNGQGRPDNGVYENYGNQNFNRPRPNGPNRPFENNGNYNGNQGQNYQNQYNKPNRYPPNNYGNPGYDRPIHNPHQHNGLNDNREDNVYGPPPPNYGNNFNNRPPPPNQFNNDIPQINPGNQNNYNENNNFRPPGHVPSTQETFVNPSTEFSTSKPSSTKKPDNDVPLFIPLNPEDKDDTTNSAPKRETDKKPVDQDEDFVLDIRIKND